MEYWDLYDKERNKLNKIAFVSGSIDCFDNSKLSSKTYVYDLFRFFSITSIISFEIFSISVSSNEFKIS